MCGIVAFFGDTSQSLSAIEQSLEKIKHRGPDQSRVNQINRQASLGFVRLSINDHSSEGMQPLNFEQGPMHVVINGEFYNYAELRALPIFLNSSPSSKSLI